MPRKPRVSLVLVSKNEENNVNGFFAELSKQTKKPDEILLVDASSDNTAKLSEPFVDRLIKIDYNEARDSAGFQRNIGIKESRGDIIVFTDFDVKLYPDWLEELTKPFDAGEVNIVQGAVFVKSYGGENDNWIFGKGLKEKSIYLNHCNTAYRRKVLEKFPLNEAGYWNDIEMSYRIKGTYWVYGARNAKVYHFGIPDRKPNCWANALRANRGFVQLIFKYKDPYWITRAWVNIFYYLLTLNIKEFVYYSVAFFYVFSRELLVKLKILH